MCQRCHATADFEEAARRAFMNNDLIQVIGPDGDSIVAPASELLDVLAKQNWPAGPRVMRIARDTNTTPPSAPS